MISTNSSSSSRSAIRSSSVADETMFPTTDMWIYIDEQKVSFLD